MLTLKDLKRLLMSVMLADNEGLFHRSQRAQNPAVSTPLKVQFSLVLCLAKYEALRFSSWLVVKSRYPVAPKCTVLSPTLAIHFFPALVLRCIVTCISFIEPGHARLTLLDSRQRINAYESCAANCNHISTACPPFRALVSTQKSSHGIAS